MCSRYAHNRTQSGAVLPVVLWVVTIGLGLAASFSAYTRTSTHVVINNKAVHELRHAGKAGMYLALQQVLDMQQQADRATVQPPVIVEVDNYRVVVNVRYNHEMLPVNTAGVKELERLLLRHGISDERASIVSDSIIDWRDRDRTVSMHGMEDAGYSERGAFIGARDAPIRDLEEIRMINGVNDAVFSILKNNVTLYPATAGRVVSLVTDAYTKQPGMHYRIEAQVSLTNSGQRPYKILKMASGTRYYESKVSDE